VPRFAFVDVVPYSGTVTTRLLNPNALSSSQVNQLISQRPERDQLRYGNSELAFLLNSPTIREKENEKKKSPMKSTAVRKIVLEGPVDKQQTEQLQESAVNLLNTLQGSVAGNSAEVNESVSRPAVEQIKMLLNKRSQENEPEKEQAAEVEQAPAKKVDRRKSVNTALQDFEESADVEVDSQDQESEEDEMESIAQSFSRPTKSGRVPKLRDLKSLSEEAEPKPKVGLNFLLYK